MISRDISEKEAVVKLWYHECMRVFHDKLADFEDRFKFFATINSITAKYFEIHVKKLENHKSAIFVDFQGGLSFSPLARNYEEVTSVYLCHSYWYYPFDSPEEPLYVTLLKIT